MHETERHRLILSTVQNKPVLTVHEIVELTGASEATIRRDIAFLHLKKRVKRVRGGVEALVPPQVGVLLGRTYTVNEGIRIFEKKTIAQQAVELCQDGDSIILNGGTTTFQMTPWLSTMQMQILTNSFPIAEYLLKHSKSTVMLPGGIIYREQNIILNPFDSEFVRGFHAHRIFMGAYGVGPFGVMEADPLLVQAEQRLAQQADDIILLVDSSKFSKRSSFILFDLSRVSVVITDDQVDDKSAQMLDQSGVKLIVVSLNKKQSA